MKSSGVRSSRKTPTLLDALRTSSPWAVDQAEPAWNIGFPDAIGESVRSGTSSPTVRTTPTTVDGNGAAPSSSPDTQMTDPGSMPRAAAEPSLTSSSSGASPPGRRPATRTGIARPRREVGAVDLHHRGRRGAARRRSSPAASSSTTPWRRGAPRGIERMASSSADGTYALHVWSSSGDPGSTPSGQKSMRTSGGSESGEELVDGDGGAATGCPGRQRHRGGETGEHRQRARGDPVPADERARPHPCRLAHHRAPLWRHVRANRPGCWHIGGRGVVSHTTAETG